MRLIILLLASVLALPAQAKTPCGGAFDGFVAALKSEAVANGHSKRSVNTFFAPVRQDPKVLRADRSQGVFKMAFLDFSKRVISQNRMNNGTSNARKYASVFARAEQDYGVPAGVLLAFWALETDFGAVQGEFNTLNSLVTLSHDCRRPSLFRPQIFAALELFERGDFDPATTKGAWAGEIGMVQMLPEDILTNGVDGDGDGTVSLKTSAPDALLSGAKMLKGLGWRANEPWLQEVRVPSGFDWGESGLQTTKTVREWARLGVSARSGSLAEDSLAASVLLPQGKDGPAFLAYPNFNVYFEWNQSFVYVTTAAYFATRLSGEPVYDPRTPATGLSDAQMKALQTRLKARGYDVGKVDGILGAKTRSAVQMEQKRLRMPADAWPTPALLNKL
jgi:lytic murein transglycosylase